MALTVVSKAKATLDAGIVGRRKKEAIEAWHAFDEVKPLANWTIHDLRRSAATWMAQNGVPPHVLGRS